MQAIGNKLMLALRTDDSKTNDFPWRKAMGWLLSV